jgi:hypothetical protein
VIPSADERLQIQTQIQLLLLTHCPHLQQLADPEKSIKSKAARRKEGIKAKTAPPSRH